MDEEEKQKLIKALRHNKGRQAGAARDLDISPQLMRYKMKKHGLTKEMFKPGGIFV